MPLDLLHNVFLLDLAFEATQRALQSLTILQMDFCQIYSPPSGTNTLTIVARD